ncbi:MAG TPA: hypothetical protein VK735_27495 [Pseudonocardia sp.]|uniref:hypothetical protein n=1 Tax=Pseudonocardia sp. TaxID=60912 RepID=UPI002CD2E4A2|nr:hypothetical protein [Pseudonocardia sp.]HTF51203.1 hypothetical protein [Pseudonocardia sp.]
MVAALLLGGAMAVVHSAIPTDPSGTISWAIDSSHRNALQVALGLVPFAGIFFLWFMGAVRDYFGEAEDKFFATLFLGSGLLFVAMLFVLSSEVTNSLAAASTDATPVASRLQGVLTLLTSYCTRMAAVFTIATTTIGRSLGIFPRWLVWLGYLVAVILLFINVGWLVLIFPVWVLALSGYIFLAHPDRQSTRTPIS